MEAFAPDSTLYNHLALSCDEIMREQHDHVLFDGVESASFENGSDRSCNYLDLVIFLDV